MQIPAAISYLGPLVPVVFRAGTAALCWRAALQPLGDAKRTDEHRSLIVALAGFSLAGIAIIGTQGSDKFGPPFFDITLSFLCYVASLGVQGWKAWWWQDALGDALRDAATTAMLLFIVRLTIVAAPDLGWEGWQFGVVAAAAGGAWLFDPGFPLLVSAGVWRGVHIGNSTRSQKAAPARSQEGSPEARP